MGTACRKNVRSKVPAIGISYSTRGVIEKAGGICYKGRFQILKPDLMSFGVEKLLISVRHSRWPLCLMGVIITGGTGGAVSSYETHLN